MNWRPIAIGGGVLGAIFGIVFLSTRTTTPRRIALIGDSYAVGLGPQLANLLPNFKYEGHVGISTGRWLSCSTCGAWLGEFRPDLVLVSLGVNDGANQNVANYQRILQGLRALGARVVWIEPPAAVNTPARQVIDSLGVPVVPGTPSPLSADGLHPRSYTSWAQEVAQYA